MIGTKREGKSSTKVARFYSRVCSPLPIRVSELPTIEWG